MSDDVDKDIYKEYVKAHTKDNRALTRSANKFILTSYRTVHREPAQKKEGKRRLKENRRQDQLGGAPEDDKGNSVQN